MSRVMKILGVIVMMAVVISIAKPAAAVPTVVDLELVLAVDVSGSVSGSEFALQRDGYVNAFKNSSIVDAIQKGKIGSIAATLVYWSGQTQQAQSVGWTMISDAATSTAFANAIAAVARPYSGSTGLGSALAYSGTLFANSGYDGTRQVIDVSGDGSNNDGTSSSAGRAAALASGTDTINGIVIGSSSSVFSHYQTDVIGGTDAFAMQVNDFSGFAKAIDDKLVKEITSGQPTDPTIPEPASMTLLGAGLLSLIGFKRKKRS